MDLTEIRKLKSPFHKLRCEMVKAMLKLKCIQCQWKVIRQKIVNKCHPAIPLRKHAYSNILKILPPKTENFQIEFFYIFHISTQNIDCGYSLEPHRRGGSNEYPQSMFLAEIRKIMYTPVNPSFTI